MKKMFLITLAVLTAIVLFLIPSQVKGETQENCNPLDYNHFYPLGEEDEIEVDEEGFDLYMTPHGAIWLQKGGWAIREVCVQIQFYNGSRTGHIVNTGGSGTLKYIHEGEIESIYLKVVPMDYNIFIPLFIME